MNRFVVALITAATVGGVFLRANIADRPIAGPVSPPAAAAQPSGPSKVSLSDPSAIVLLLRASGRLDERIDVLVKNDELADRRGHLTAFFTDSSTGEPTTLIKPDSVSRALKPGLTPLSLRLLGFGIPAGRVLSGFVLLRVDSAPGNAPSTLYRPIRVVSAPVPPVEQGRSILIGFGVTVFCLVVGGWKFLFKGQTYQHALQSDWAASDSWASNFTVLGAVGTTLMTVATSAIVLGTMTRAEYAALSALLAFVVALTPALFAFLKGVMTTGRGSRWAFVIASMFTLMAAFGQTYLLVVLLTDIMHGGGLNAIAYGATVVLMTLLALALAAFAIASLRRATAPEQEIGPRAGASNVMPSATPAASAALPTVQPLL